ncbi:hypothetical protein GQ43DRAFT_497078 [Delitschia confertaspora ATCC 74209]|uniref:Uncharacterized protein n=1 Tax=Delitschia confertaspora ATCC 74209 TaxID=1513339 RepID=A0A9P4N1K8_9PLEO|nr:hypothetical protein GQ43DRAFT_497078 [Delitschia confertaspora ATCC 74209]
MCGYIQTLEIPPGKPNPESGLLYPSETKASERPRSETMKSSTISTSSPTTTASEPSHSHIAPYSLDLSAIWSSPAETIQAKHVLESSIERMLDAAHRNALLDKMGMRTYIRPYPTTYPTSNSWAGSTGVGDEDIEGMKEETRIMTPMQQGPTRKGTGSVMTQWADAVPGAMGPHVTTALSVAGSEERAESKTQVKRMACFSTEMNDYNEETTEAVTHIRSITATDSLVEVEFRHPDMEGATTRVESESTATYASAARIMDGAPSIEPSYLFHESESTASSIARAFTTFLTPTHVSTLMGHSARSFSSPSPDNPKGCSQFTQKSHWFANELHGKFMGIVLGTPKSKSPVSSTTTKSPTLLSKPSSNAPYPKTNLKRTNPLRKTGSGSNTKEDKKNMEEGKMGISASLPFQLGPLQTFSTNPAPPLSSDLLGGQSGLGLEFNLPDFPLISIIFLIFFITLGLLWLVIVYLANFPDAFTLPVWLWHPVKSWRYVRSGNWTWRHDSAGGWVSGKKGKKGAKITKPIDKPSKYTRLTLDEGRCEMEILGTAVSSSSAYPSIPLTSTSTETEPRSEGIEMAQLTRRTMVSKQPHFPSRVTGPSNTPPWPNIYAAHHRSRSLSPENPFLKAPTPAPTHGLRRRTSEEWLREREVCLGPQETALYIHSPSHLQTPLPAFNQPNVGESAYSYSLEEFDPEALQPLVLSSDARQSISSSTSSLLGKANRLMWLGNNGANGNSHSSSRSNGHSGMGLEEEPKKETWLQSFDGVVDKVVNKVVRFTSDGGGEEELLLPVRRRTGFGDKID